MPAQKRPRDSSASPPSPYPPLEEEKPDDLLPGCENHVPEKLDDLSDSEGSSVSGNGENEEFIVVKLAEVRKEVQCPICLGIIRKTRTVMECLHRFCRECIDKSMRLGNNECPACRTHCASRRSLRDDPNYDALISAFYPDIEKYEEEESVFHEEEKARNEKIQALIAQTFRRQAEALGKKKTPVRSTAAASSRRQSSSRASRGRRNHRSAGHNESDEEEVAVGNDRSKDSSSTDEHSAEARSERPKRWSSSRTSKPSSGVIADGGSDENALEINTEASGASAAGAGRLKKVLEWGRSGVRSNTRRGGDSWTNGRISRQNRLSKLMNRLQSSHEHDDAPKITLKLISLYEEEIASLKRPYLFCSTTSSVSHVTQYVAKQTSIKASQLQMRIVNGTHSDFQSKLFRENLPVMFINTPTLPLLNEQETLDGILAKFPARSLVLGYERKPLIITEYEAASS